MLEKGFAVTRNTGNSDAFIYILENQETSSREQIDASLIASGWDPAVIQATWDEFEEVNSAVGGWGTSPICPTCGSYMHPFIAACISCGAALGYRGLGDSETETWYAKEHSPAEVARDTIETGQIVNDTLVKIGYRYLGGLPGQVAPFDATLSIAGSELLLAGRAGEVARVHVSNLLAVVPFVEEVPLLKGAFGVGFGNAFGFANPTFVGGGLVVTYAANGQPFSFTVGNRSGLTLTAKGKPGFFRSVAELIGIWANDAVLGRQAEAGAQTYAHELGLEPPHPAAAETPLPSATAANPPVTAEFSPSAGNSPAETSPLAARLAELTAAHESGLVSDDEYAAKRTEILERF